MPISKPQKIVVKELRELFDVDNYFHVGSSEKDGKFFISKKHMERLLVLDRLQGYFNGVTVQCGYVSVEEITFIHTIFEVCNGVP